MLYLFDKDSRKKLISIALTIPASTTRAQCYRLANLRANGMTMADRVAHDHKSIDGVLRACKLLVEAGIIDEIGGDSRYYGDFHFPDGSIIR